MEELKSFYFNTHYLCTIAYISPLVPSFHDFIVLFLLLAKRFLLSHMAFYS
jgi:hypothetical protein